jgi:hypothetical protein
MSAYELQEKRLLEEIEPWGVKAMAKAAWLVCCSMGYKKSFNKFYEFFCKYDNQHSEEQEDGFFEQFR